MIEQGVFVDELNILDSHFSDGHVSCCHIDIFVQ